MSNNILPKNATPLELALAQLTADRLNIDVENIKITLTPKNAPENVLPFIAWQEHVDVWKEDYTVEQKKEIITTARQVHAQKGTIGALKLALENLGLDAEVSEWYQYGGDPHYFKVSINVYDKPISIYDDQLIWDEIMETKNLRSIIDELIFWITAKAFHPIATAIQWGEIITIYPIIAKGYEGGHVPYLGAAYYWNEQLTIYPLGGQ